MAGLTNAIFNLPSNQDELRIPEEVIKVSTRKIIPTTDSTLEGFPGNDITFDFTLSGNQHWIPSRSFVVIRDSIYVGHNIGAAAGTDNQPSQPRLNDGVAPSLNLQDNLFDGCQLTMGGFSLGSRTNLCPQISACNKRIKKSAGWLNGVGKSAHTWDADFNKRLQDIIKFGATGDPTTDQLSANLRGTVTTIDAVPANDDAENNRVEGTNTRFQDELEVGEQIRTAGGNVYTIQNIELQTRMTVSSNQFVGEANATYQKFIQGYPTSRSNRNERIYIPPLGIFSYQKALPPSRYELILRPKPEVIYKQCAIQTAAAEAVGIIGGVRNTVTTLPNGEAEYLVDSIVFYIAVVDNFAPVPAKMNYVLDLEETEVTPRPISGDGSVQENFTVSKSTYALTVALQSKTAGKSTLFPPSLFKVTGNHELELEKLRVDFSGQSRPQPDAQPEFAVSDPVGASHIDYQTYRYIESSVEDLAYYDTGGDITKDDWRKLGPLYHFQWRRVGDDISTNVDIEVVYPNVFEDVAGNRQENLLLFHHYKRVIELTVESSEVTQFLAQDA